jgi:Delta7-sterol 5-desaturase
MDYILDFADEALLNKVYPPSWPADDIFRQALSLYLIVNVGGALVYFIPAVLNYFLIFDHNLMKHKLFLKNQVSARPCTSKQSLLFLTLYRFREVTGWGGGGGGGGAGARAP